MNSEPILKFEPEDISRAVDLARDTFLVRRDDFAGIMASSRDWFKNDVWGRDCFIALPGLLLTDHDGEDELNLASKITKSFGELIENGIIPNRIFAPEEKEDTEYNTSDGSMWFVHAVKQIYERKKKLIDDSSAIKYLRDIFSHISSVMESYRKGTTFFDCGESQKIYLAKDGLIMVPEASTWMDSNPLKKGAITPRNGKPIEINALWYSNLKFMAHACARLGYDEISSQYTQLAATVFNSFRKGFINPHYKDFPDSTPVLDVFDDGLEYKIVDGRLQTIDPSTKTGRDLHAGAIRCNMLYAVAIDQNLLPREIQEAIFAVASKDLFTGYGLRSLSPRDSQFRDDYDTRARIEDKDSAYHQGTVWTHLIGPYVDAAKTVNHSTDVRALLTPIANFLMVNEYDAYQGYRPIFHSLPELFSAKKGEEHIPHGTSSQAWAISEFRRVAIKYNFI